MNKQTLDSLVSTFRNQLSTALQHPDTRDFSHPSTRSAPTTPSLTSRISSFLDLPTNSPSSSSSQGQLGVPFSSSSHTSVPIEGEPSTAFPQANPDDSLPTYSRRAPFDPSLLSSLPPKRLHSLSSRTGKLHLELQARGREHVILIQEQPDGPTDLSGILRLELKDPETITHVKIRLKGIVRTLVMKAHASGRHPVSDEITFHESSQTVYNYSERSPPFLPSNESIDPTKLLGSFTFPFELSVPDRITHYTCSTLPGQGASSRIALNRPTRPPPSFMLDSHSSFARRDQRDGLNWSGGLSTGGFEVSCRYFIKVTLGRKGLLKVNERWIIPVVFVPRQPRLTLSPMRELSIVRGEERPPHSIVDPEGWTEAGKYRMRRTIKKSATWGKMMSSNGSMGGGAEIEIEGRTIRGQKIERGDAGSPGGTGTVPFEVAVTTTNVKVTGKIQPSMINVFLVQRVAITAQRLTNAQDVIVSRATAMHPCGYSAEGQAVEVGSGRNQGWKVEFGGTIKLPPSLGVSFKVPNLAVTYVLCFSVNIGGISNDLTPLTIPIELINCPPLQPPALPPPSLETPPPPPPPSLSPTTAPPPLPRHPSKPASSTIYSPPLGNPPNSATSQTNTPTTTASTSTTTSSSTLSVQPPPPRNRTSSISQGSVDSRIEEERELESVYGLPPSYFDVVGFASGGDGRSNGNGNGGAAGGGAGEGSRARSGSEGAGGMLRRFGGRR